jgi:general secretion pathway protein B
MSMILDALRKAEAERQRGQVPGLHGATLGGTGTAPPQAGAGRAAGAARPVWPWVALVLLPLAAAALWLWLQRQAPTSPALVEATAPQASPAAPVAVPLPPSPAAEPGLPRVLSAPPAPAPAAALPAAPPAAPAVAAAAAPAPAPAPIVTRVRRLADLPPEQRRELPALVVSGSVYSEQAASRFVVIDGQLLREGDSLVPGLVLVKIAPRAATLGHRGVLIEVPL